MDQLLSPAIQLSSDARSAASKEVCSYLWLVPTTTHPHPEEGRPPAMVYSSCSI